LAIVSFLTFASSFFIFITFEDRNPTVDDETGKKYLGGSCGGL
jgi:hypothetical protein